MASHNPVHQAHHSSKHYMVLGTILVVGIFVLLLLNDDGTTLTGNIAGLTTIEESSGDVLGTLEQGDGIATTTTDAKKAKDRRSSKIDHSFALTIDSTPQTIQEKVEIESLTVTFTDLDTIIKVDSDELSLRDLDSIRMSISDFEGDFLIDDYGFSAVGTGKELVVNGVVLSADKTMDISVQRIDFDSLALESALLGEMIFEDAFGDLTLQEKLTYTIEGEDLSIGSFSGDLSLDADGSVLDGKVSSFNLEGGLDIQVK